MMPQRRSWAEIVDSDDEKLASRDASPAPSFCSTQMTWEDYSERCQELTRTPFNGTSDAPTFDGMLDADSEILQQDAMEPASNVMGFQMVMPVLCFVPMQASGVPPTQDFQQMSAPDDCNLLRRMGQAGSVKKRILKNTSAAVQGRLPVGSRGRALFRQRAGQHACPARPNATEADWQRRLQKRRGIVESIKASPEYKACSSRHEGRRRRSLPRTPSPDDRSVSKRQWEEKVSSWRAALREYLPSDNKQDMQV